VIAISVEYFFFQKHFHLRLAFLRNDDDDVAGMCVHETQNRVK
jgi:hypothetical protein